MDIWAKLGDHPNYEVSNQGEVRNVNTGRILKPQLNKSNGQYRVSLENHARCYIHRLVAETFLGASESNSYVRHIDGDNSNNKLSNLEVKSINKAYADDGIRVPIVRCHECRRRGTDEFCSNKPDDFFCANGKI